MTCIIHQKKRRKYSKPSPIISPVYGILDKDYPKDEIRRSSENSYNAKEASVDEIRNKAYGSPRIRYRNNFVW